VALKFLLLIAFLVIATALLVIFLPHTKDTTKFNLVSPTSGNFTQTQKINVVFDNKKDIAMATIKEMSVPAIEQNQNVILYDKENNVLPLGGKIAFIRKSKEELNILIALPQDTDTALLTNKAEIITMDAPALNLLPQKVLQQNDDGSNFIWIAKKQDGDKYKFIKQPYNLIYSNDNFIALSQSLKKDALVLINPNDNIDENKTYNANVKIFQTTRHNPIYLSWLEYIEQKRITDQAQMAQNLQDCIDKNSPKQQAPASDQPLTSGASSSCGGSSGGIISAEEIFANIKQEGQNSNSCGSNSCGQ